MQQKPYTLTLRLYPDNEQDEALIQKIQSIKNKNEYVKNLLSKELNNEHIEEQFEEKLRNVLKEFLPPRTDAAPSLIENKSIESDKVPEDDISNSSEQIEEVDTDISGMSNEVKDFLNSLGV